MGCGVGCQTLQLGAARQAGGWCVGLPVPHPPARTCPHPHAQAMEAAGSSAELADEIELLKLRLDIAETEKCEAAQQVARECGGSGAGWVLGLRGCCASRLPGKLAPGVCSRQRPASLQASRSSGALTPGPCLPARLPPPAPAELQVLLQQVERSSGDDGGGADATITPAKQLLPGAGGTLPADLPADVRRGLGVLQEPALALQPASALHGCLAAVAASSQHILPAPRCTHTSAHPSAHPPLPPLSAGGAAGGPGDPAAAQQPGQQRGSAARHWQRGGARGSPGGGR